MQARGTMLFVRLQTIIAQTVGVLQAISPDFQKDTGYETCFEGTHALVHIHDCQYYLKGVDADVEQRLDVEEIYDNVLNRDEYDIRELDPDPFPPEYVSCVSVPLISSMVWGLELTPKTTHRFYVQYLNTPAVQAAIGAYVNFSGTYLSNSLSMYNPGQPMLILVFAQSILQLLAMLLTRLVMTPERMVQ